MFRKDKEPDPLRNAYDKAILKLNDQTIGSQEYDDTLEAISKLQKLLVETKPAQISLDTVVTVGANLVGIGMIIHHEKVNVITSKAMGHVTKLRP